MSQLSSVAAALRGDIATGEQVRVRGWLRSKRDSKAGISFLAIHDGSAFDAIQAVVPQDLLTIPSGWQSQLPILVLGAALVMAAVLAGRLLED